MKKLLLVASIAAFATAAQAELLQVTLTGDAVLSKADDANYGSGEFSSAVNAGSYDTETGIMTFAAGTVANTQRVPSAGAELSITGDMNVNFTNLTGDSVINSCSDNIGGVGCLGGGFNNFIPGFEAERRVFQSVELGGDVDLSNPGTFMFTAVIYDALQQVTITTDYTAVVTPASEVPVPAAAWLFGSALAGLAGLRKRK